MSIYLGSIDILFFTISFNKTLILCINPYLGLFFLDTVNSEASFDIVEKTEIFIGLLNGNNIWKK